VCAAGPEGRHGRDDHDETKRGRRMQHVQNGVVQAAQEEADAYRGGETRPLGGYVVIMALFGALLCGAAGLASATGIRPYLPPLLAGALARSDIAIDFDGTDFSFLESPAFLGGVVAVGVVAFLLERQRSPSPGRGAAEVLSGVMGILLGGLLFGGALADGGEVAWPGLLLGPLCAVLGWLGVELPAVVDGAPVWTPSPRYPERRMGAVTATEPGLSERVR